MPQAIRVAVRRALLNRIAIAPVAYQVIARKWRPQRFEDVVGQQAVTQTLRNALASGRLAQAFVFAGARGVGKTTTARILARALNCVNGPTPDPCGQCDACVEIAQGRDLDVLEIDAASNTGIDNVREVIISNLAISPARDRYKIFIIDEVHQLSNHSFNALLKSVEEPPPHVVFIMATTELHKIPDTIQSRAQVYEFRTIAAAAIAGQLRHIADAEGISIGDDALTILARYAEGSMRDAQSAFDQVLSFAGATVTAADVASVLGLVGRDLLFDILRAVADEDASAAFALAGRGGRGRLRPSDPLPGAGGPGTRDDAGLHRPAAPVGSRGRVRVRPPAASGAGDALLARGPAALVRPGRAGRSRRAAGVAAAVRARDGAAQVDPPAQAGAAGRPDWPAGKGRGDAGPSRVGAAAPRRAASRRSHLPRARPVPRAASPPRRGAAPPRAAPRPRAGASPRQSVSRAADGPLPADFKDRFLAELQRQNRTFFNLHVATAQRIELDGGRLVFTFGPVHETMRQQVDARRRWLESLAESVAGRKVGVTTARGAATDAPARAAAGGTTPPAPTSRRCPTRI